MSLFSNFLLVLLAGCFAVVGFGFYMLARNQWVYKQRMTILHRSIREYEQLPDYDAMLNRFWVWDVKKFLR